MANSKKKSKKIKIGTILTAILLIVILIVVIVVHSYNSKSTREAEEKLNYIISDEWNDELYPDGMPELIRNYSGELTAQNIGKSMYYVTMELIPKYRQEFKGKTEKEISEYFEKNKDAIAIDTGISNVSDFKNFVNEIEIKSKTDNLEFDSYYIDQNSIEQEDTKTTANLYIDYKGCAEVELKVEISNQLDKEITSVKYLTK